MIRRPLAISFWPSELQNSTSASQRTGGRRSHLVGWPPWQICVGRTLAWWRRHPKGTRWFGPWMLNDMFALGRKCDHRTVIIWWYMVYVMLYICHLCVMFILHNTTVSFDCSHFSRPFWCFADVSRVGQWCRQMGCLAWNFKGFHMFPAAIWRFESTWAFGASGLRGLLRSLWGGYSGQCSRGVVAGRCDLADLADFEKIVSGAARIFWSLISSEDLKQRPQIFGVVIGEGGEGLKLEWYVAIYGDHMRSRWFALQYCEIGSRAGIDTWVGDGWSPLFWFRMYWMYCSCKTHCALLQKLVLQWNPFFEDLTYLGNHENFGNALSIIFCWNIESIFPPDLNWFDATFLIYDETLQSHPTGSDEWNLCPPQFCFVTVNRSRVGEDRRTADLKSSNLIFRIHIFLPCVFRVLLSFYTILIYSVFLPQSLRLYHSGHPKTHSCFSVTKVQLS